MQVISQAKEGAVVVSACLLGRRCRYDGSSNPSADVERIAAGRRIVPVCPEELGGLGTPRPPAQIEGGTAADVLDGRARVVTNEGRDVSREFRAGAQAALEAAKQSGATLAILKEKSPSCGVCRVYREGKLVAGRGVTAALLAQHGIELVPLDAPKRKHESSRRFEEAS